MKYEMERDLLDELCAQHHESGWREGYEQCRMEMTDECDRRVREAERHGRDEDLAAVPAAHGRHLRAERREVASITDELRHEVANYPFRDNRDFALFEDIADRIDAEHRRRIADVGRAACNAVREVCGS